MTISQPRTQGLVIIIIIKYIVIIPIPKAKIRRKALSSGSDREVPALMKMTDGLAAGKNE